MQFLNIYKILYNVISWGLTHSTIIAKEDYENATEGQNQRLGHFAEWLITPCVPVLHVLINCANSCRAPRPACRQGRRYGPARSAYWPMVLSSLVRQGGGHGLHARACGAGEDVFHTRGRRRQEGAPREPVRGDRRRAVLDSFEQLQIDFQAKHICIRKTVLQAI